MSQTRVQLIGDSFDNGVNFVGVVTAIDVDISRNATISGIATVEELLTPQIKTDAISNESGTGPVELKEGGILPVSKTLSGDGSINISGNVSTSEIQANTISNLVGTGPIELKEGATLPSSKILGGSGNINISGDITGGTITGTNPIKVDKITNKLDNGPVELKEGAILPAGKTLSGDGNINITGNVDVGGEITVNGSPISTGGGGVSFQYKFDDLSGSSSSGPAPGRLITSNALFDQSTTGIFAAYKDSADADLTDFYTSFNNVTSSNKGHIIVASSSDSSKYVLFQLQE